MNGHPNREGLEAAHIESRFPTERRAGVYFRGQIITRAGLFPAATWSTTRRE